MQQLKTLLNNINNIVFIDAETGTVIAICPCTRKCLSSASSVGRRREKITFISLTEEGEGIMSYNLADK